MSCFPLATQGSSLSKRMQQGPQPTVTHIQRKGNANPAKKEVPKNLIDLSLRKKSFTIKTSVQQTRFSMKAIKEHMDQFIKHSNWVLVNSKAEKLGTDLSQQ